MPVRTGKDSKGCYAQWGSKTKYYYTCGNTSARASARTKAGKQGAAAHASGYIGNQRKGIGMLKRMQVITANISGPVRHDTMEGRDFLVAPMTMIVEGVLNGSEGPLLYTKEELSKDPWMWNHKPVVVYHPKRNGVGISACDPETLTNHKVGVIMNTEMGTVKVKEKDVPALKAEAWLESDRMEAVDSRVSDAVENNKMMELSTGLRVEFDEEEGEFNGEDYIGIAHNFKPDHLALLPDLKGASSIADGAGLLQLNEISHADVRGLLNSKLRGKDDTLWIDEVFDDFFIYEDDGRLYKQEYEEDDGEVSFVSIPVVVVREVSFSPVTNIASIEKGKVMKKRKIVEALIANKASQFGDDDEETLMDLSKDVLEKMAPVVNEEEETKEKEHKEEVSSAAEKSADDKSTPETSTEGTSEASETPVENKEPKTVEQYISEAPAEIQGMLQNGLDSYQNDKARLIKVITDNKKNKFTNEQLQTKDVSELRNLAALATNVAQPAPQPLGHNYAGQAEVVEETEDEEEPMETPTLNFGEEKEKKKTA